MQDEGMKYFANGLQHNTVNKYLHEFNIMFKKFSSQSLTTLDIGHNDLESEAAQYLAMALKENKVIFVEFVRNISIQCKFIIDTEDFENELQRYWSFWNEVSC